MKVVTENGIINYSQTQNLTKTIQNLRKTVIYIDTRKAFDTVSKNKLTKKTSVLRL